MSRPILVMFIVIAIVIHDLAVAQLNFTPNWGKRTNGGGAPAIPSAGAEMNDNNSNNCKQSVDTIMVIYKIIQNEAQKLLECDKFGN